MAARGVSVFSLFIIRWASVFIMYVVLLWFMVSHDYSCVLFIGGGVGSLCFLSVYSQMGLGFH